MRTRQGRTQVFFQLEKEIAKSLAKYAIDLERPLSEVLEDWILERWTKERAPALPLGPGPVWACAACKAVFPSATGRDAHAKELHPEFPQMREAPKKARKG